VGQAGWVARLSSGMATLEANSHQAPLHRGLARSGAILATLQRLDARLAGADSDHPVSIRPCVLQQEVEQQDVPPLSGVVRSLLRAADEAMEHADDIGCISPQRGLDDSLVLALAWSFTGHGRYAERGSRILERLFVDQGARMDPFPGNGPDAGAAVAGMRGMYYYLDAVRICEGAGSIGESAKADFRIWLDARLAWMLSSPGVAERRAGDHRGTCYDLQMASIASFLDDQT